jgi:hypothetical protein
MQKTEENHVYLNRWISPDTIVPDPANPQSLNRYSYVLGNPLRFVDPTGHNGKEPPKPRIGYDKYYPDLRVAVVYGGSPGALVDADDEALSKLVSFLGLLVDCGELSIATIGTANQGSITLGGAVGGTLLGIVAGRDPGPTVEVAGSAGGATTGAAVGAIVSMPADTFEDFFSYTGIGLDVLADLIGRNSYLDSDTNEWVIGQDTLVAIALQAVDQCIPGSAADLALSGGGTIYDFYMMLPETTGWMELRVPRDDWMGAYFVFYPDVISDPKERETLS